MHRNRISRCVVVPSSVLCAAGVVVSRVNVSSVRVEDGGVWTCRATNRAGAAVHTGTVHVYGASCVCVRVCVCSSACVCVRCAMHAWTCL